jgi:hypothetical protein
LCGPGLIPGDKKTIRKLRIQRKRNRANLQTIFELKTMQTTEQLRAARKGPLEIPSPTKAHSTGVLEDASGDLVEVGLTESDDIANRAANEADDSRIVGLTAALSADLQPLGEALAGALQAGDEAAFRAALKKITARMPDFLETSALEEAMQGEFIKALTEEKES